jgi:hypothetical protein
MGSLELERILSHATDVAIADRNTAGRTDEQANNTSAFPDLSEQKGEWACRWLVVSVVCERLFGSDVTSLRKGVRALFSRKPSEQNTW